MVDVLVSLYLISNAICIKNSGFPWDDQQLELTGEQSPCLEKKATKTLYGMWYKYGV